jgi:L-asparaginase
LRLALISLLVATSVAQAGAQLELPRVLILATGGTIAGEQRQPGTQEAYEIRRSIAEMVASVPEIRRYARVETEQFSNVPSPNIGPSDWLRLGQQINTVLKQRPELSGIVVTHGTARLDETAFFLHLSIQSDKPVILVGAQRPPTGISPDGNLNLLAGVRVAAVPQSAGKGVLVVMDERISSARDAEKVFARAGGFSGGEMGTLGVIAPHGVEFFYEPVRRHTVRSEFTIDGLTELPRVDIHYSYAGSNERVNTAPQTDVKGIVVATTGLTPAERLYYEGLARRGVIVAATFPSGDDIVEPAAPRDTVSPLGVARLSPLHTRILLMLALTRTSDRVQIQRILNEY